MQVVQREDGVVVEVERLGLEEAAVLELFEGLEEQYFALR